MQRASLLARLVVTVALVAVLAVIAAVMTEQVSATANRMRVDEAARLSLTMAQYLEKSHAEDFKDLGETEPPAPRWRLRPGDAGDRAMLSEVAQQMTTHGAAGIFDRAGRRTSAAGTPGAIPAATDPGHRPMLNSLHNHPFGLSAVMRTSGGQRVIAMAVRSRSTPGAVLAIYVTTEEEGLDLYLRQFAEGGHGHYYLLDAHGLVAWAGDAHAHDQPLPGLSQASGLNLGDGMTEVDIHGEPTVVISHRSVYGWRLVYQQSAATFFGDIDRKTHRIVYALVALLVVVAVAHAYSAYRRHRSAQDSADQLRGLVADINDVVLVLQGTRVTYVSPAVAHLLDISERLAIGCEIDELVGSAGSAILQRLIAASSGHTRAVRAGDVPCQTRTGRMVWAETTVADRTATRSIGGFVVSMHDVTERREAAERLLHDATHDRLTGLANRARFAESVDLAMRRARRSDVTVAVLYLDLDGFKPINDSFGHGAGDQVLREVAARLATCLRAADLPARLGGDEFAVVLDPPVDAHQAEEISRRIIAAINQPIHFPGEVVQVGVSIGIAVAQGAAESPDALVRSADLAMYHAKETGRNRYHTSAPPGPTWLEVPDNMEMDTPQS